MTRLEGGMELPRRLCLLLAGFSLISFCNAGPIGPLTNVTSSDLGVKEGSCAVGDVVYMVGDEFPGSSPCERCACAGGSVSCTRQHCEPRPGCKALHRPDQCCPTYQCECEQDGRTYSNGEKLVDPADPCRVCYCQGGEVVCRRIACFRRDDCRPRLVPGRCCPEYDNCPLRGVTTIAGVAPTTTSVSSVDIVEPSAAPPAPKENIKKEITIKEITPVSEIPAITDVKIKEILPSSGEVTDYSSSKSPLIPREATSEKNSNSQVELTERPMIVEIHSSSSPEAVSSSSPEIIASSSEISEIKTTHDSSPSKISLSTQDSINSDIYPSNDPTMGSSPIIHEVIPVATTVKAPVILEEEDQSLNDHNPAFPPIPDDLSLVGNHQDEMNSDPNVEGDHISSSHDVVTVTSTTTEAHLVTEIQSTTHKQEIKEASEPTTPSVSTSEVTLEAGTGKVDEVSSISTTTPKQSSMLNLRSALPTEILNIPSFTSEDINGELDEITETTSVSDQTAPAATTENVEKPEETVVNDIFTSTSEKPLTNPSLPGIKIIEITTPQNSDAFITKNGNEEPITILAKSNIATEITAQTEFSSLPIETSDQNPHEETSKDKLSTSSSAESTVVETIPTNIPPVEPEIITVSRETPANTETQSFENVETTEFVLTSFGSSETATDAVEVIKISPEVGKSAAIIESGEEKKNNVLNDLIDLVGDVASISDHTDGPAANQHVPNAPSLSDSEELIPVNAGYKSKNNNWNVNSITEVPKTKNSVPVIKQKVMEIEDEESDGLTDSPPPNDKVEPTTRRPIIDNVTDDQSENKTETKDIEFIPQTFVPSVDRRPTKVVMKKNNEKPISDDDAVGEGLLAATSEANTDGKAVSSELTTSADVEASPSENKLSTDEASSTSTSSTPQ